MSKIEIIQKSKPAPQDLHDPRILSDLSVALMAEDRAYKADTVATPIFVPHFTDKYRVYTSADFHRTEARKRAHGTEYHNSGYTFGEDTFFCENYSDSVKYNVLEASQDDLNEVENMLITKLANSMNIKRELDFVSTLFNTGSHGYVRDGAVSEDSNSVVFWNLADSNPIHDIAVAASNIKKKTYGLRPNMLLMGETVAVQLANNQEIIGRLNGGATYAAPAILEGRVDQLLSNAFQMPVVVMDGVYDSSIEGATAAPTFFTDRSAVLGYFNPNMGRNEASLIAQFRCTRNGKRPAGVMTKRFEDTKLENVEFVSDMEYDFKIVSSACGAMFSNVVQALS